MFFAKQSLKVEFGFKSKSVPEPNVTGQFVLYVCTRPLLEKAMAVLNVALYSVPSPSPDVQSEPVSECCSVQTAVLSLQVSLTVSPPASSSDPD